MEEDKRYIKYKWGIITLIGLFSILLLYLNHLFPYLPGDDYIFQLKLPQEGILGTDTINSFSDLIESQFNLYTNYHYRVINHTVLQFLLILPPIVFDLLNTIVFLVLPIIILRGQVNVDSFSFWKKYLALILFIWIFHFDLGRCYFLTTGALNYSWLLVPQLLYLSELIMGGQRKHKISLLIFLAAVNFTSNENVQVVLFLVTLYYTINKKEWYLWLCTLLFLAGGIFMLSSPSIDNRLVEQGFRDGGVYSHLLEYVKRSSYYLIRYLPCLIFLLFAKVRLSWSDKKLRVLTFAIIASNALMLFIPLFEPRSAIFGFFLSLYLVNYLTRDKDISNILVLGLLLVAAIISIWRIPDFKSMNKRHAVNEIILENKKESKQAKLNPYCDKTKRSYLLCHELSPNAEYIDNRTIANYYRIDSVRLISPAISKLQNYKNTLKSRGSITFDSSIHLSHEAVLHKRKSDNALEIFIEDDTDGDKKYIIRGAHAGFNAHLLTNLLPKSLRLYFLDYLESDILGNDTMIKSNNVNYAYHHINESDKYSYFLVSEYSMSTHSPIGKVYYIENN